MFFIVDELFEINFNLILILVIGVLININGFIMLNVSGGMSLLMYEWSGLNGFMVMDLSIINLGIGEYCVMIMDNNFNNNCSKDICFNVYFVDLMGVLEIMVVGMICFYIEDGFLEI